VFYFLEKCTRSAADNQAWLCNFEFLADSRFTLSNVVRVNYTNAVNSHRTGKCFQVYAAGWVSIQVLSGCRILLMASHTCN
jgi:hypothetical protein